MAETEDAIKAAVVAERRRCADIAWGAYERAGGRGGEANEPPHVYWQRVIAQKIAEQIEGAK